MNILSIDIETYGACERDHLARDLPEQTVFHPRRSLYTDGVRPEQLILTVSLTLCKCSLTKSSQKDVGEKISITRLRHLEPYNTMVLRMHRPDDRRLLYDWLTWADVLVGMNLQFDLLYLRQLAQLRFLLAGRHTLVDLSVINYLHDELRPERSLKTLGPVLRTHRYDRTILDSRFPDPDDAALLSYNAQDTHNTVLAIRELARRIHEEFGSCPHPTAPSLPSGETSPDRPTSPGTAKLSPSSIQFYSDTIWTCVAMSEAGVPVNRRSLRTLEKRLVNRCARCHDITTRNFGLPLEGTGSGKAKDAFMSLACDTLDGVIECRTPQDLRSKMSGDSPSETDGPSPSSSSPSPSSPGYGGVRSHPLLQLTPKLKKISFSQENRHLLSSLIRDRYGRGHFLLHAFRLAERHAKAMKLLSSYTFPLLRYRRNRPLDRGSILIPPAGDPLWNSLASRTPATSPNGSSTSAASPPTDPKSKRGTACATSPPTPSSSTGAPAMASLSPHSTSSPPSSTPATTSRGPREEKVVSPTSSRKRSEDPTLFETGGESSSPTSSPRPSSSRLLPPTYSEPMSPNDIWLSYPTWYVTPGPAGKDDAGPMGGTQQGRITCKRHHHQTDPPPIVACRQSRFPSGSIMGVDLEQAELRVAALISGEQHLLNAFTYDVDLHTARAGVIFRIYDLDDVTPEQRQVGKTVNFADLYLAGPRKLRETITEMSGTDPGLDRCRHIVSQRHRDRPDLTEWQRSMLLTATRAGRIELPITGQSRNFAGYALDTYAWQRDRTLRGVGASDKDLTKEIVNFPIQTTAGNATLAVQHALFRALSPLQARSPHVIPFLNVYDAVYFDVHPDAATTLDAVLETAFEHVTERGYWAHLQEHYGYSVPLKWKVTKYS